MGDRRLEIGRSTYWVTFAIQTRLKPGRSRAFTSIDDYKHCSKDDLFYLRHPPLDGYHYAKLAMALFKKTKEFASVPELTNYQLVEALGSSRALYKVPRFESFKVLDWCHVCFLITENGLDQLLCFAELVDFGYGDHFLLNSISFVNSLCVVRSYGCGFCPSTGDFPHPPRVGYTAGQWEHDPIDAEYQRELALDFQRKVIEQVEKDGNMSSFFHLSDLSSVAYPRVKEPVYDPSRYTPMLLEEGYAAIALDQINKKEGADYGILHTWFAHCEILPGVGAEFHMWCHVAFAAKRPDAGAPWIYFFAEMKDEGQRKFVLNDHCIFQKTPD